MDLLEAEGVAFVVVGGIAASLQGEPRYTDDVDFMVTLPTGRVQGLVEKARVQGFDIDPEQAETQWHFGGCLRLWLGEPGSQTAMDLMACKSDFMKEVSWRAVPVRCMPRGIRGGHGSLQDRGLANPGRSRCSETRRAPSRSSRSCIPEEMGIVVCRQEPFTGGSACSSRGSPRGEAAASFRA